MLKSQIAEIKRQRGKLFNNIRGLFSMGKLSTWEEIRSRGVPISDNVAMQEFNYLNLTTAVTNWIAGTEAELNGVATTVDHPVNSPTSLVEAAIQAAPPVQQKLKVSETKGRTYGKVILFPEQQVAVDMIVAAIKNGHRAALCDADTGAGKTYVALATAIELRDQGLLNQLPEEIRAMGIKKLHPITIVVPRPVVFQYRDVAREMGILDQVWICTYGDLTTSSNATALYRLKESAYTSEVNFEWFPLAVPDLLILDEAHKVMTADSTTTRAVRGMYNSDQKTISLYFTATPFAKVNEAGTFVLSLRTSFPTIGIHTEVKSDYDFKQFASRITDNPEERNAAAMERLRKVLNPYIHSIPYVKWPSWQVNSTVLCEFENDRDRNIYKAAFAKFRERCAKMGRNADFGSLEFWVALTQFRKTAEPLRAEFYIREIQENLKNCKATTIMCAFKPTIVRVMDQVVQRGILPRDAISVVFGGFKKFRPELILPEDRLQWLLEHQEEWTPHDIRCVDETLRYQEDMVFHDETAEEQDQRHARMRDLGLMKAQTALERQFEIDKYQSGHSVLMLATLAAGGTGLSLDRNKLSLWERDVLISPVYNPREVRQAGGRHRRRGTVAGPVRQRFVFLRDTYEESHVVPIMTKGLRALAKFVKSKALFAMSPLVEGEKPILPPQAVIEAEAQLDENQIKGPSPSDNEDEDNDDPSDEENNN